MFIKVSLYLLVFNILIRNAIDCNYKVIKGVFGVKSISLHEITSSCRVSFLRVVNSRGVASKRGLFWGRGF